MFGSDGDIRGAIPRSVEYLFSSLAKKANTSEVAMVCSFLEIYNDQIRDLGKAYLVAMGVESSSSIALYEKTSDIFENLAGKRGNPYFAPAFHKAGSAVATAANNRPGLKEVQDEYNTMNYEIREDNEGNVFVKDLSLVPVSTLEEVMSLINMGLRVRATHETKMNATSSRSHTVFTITVLQRDKYTGQAVTGMLNLVDLAGSERLKKSESQGNRLKEALHINTSLSALGKVIMALDPSTETSHVPYRDSKLTRVLQNSLGGNSFTSVIAAIHPNANYYDECLSTLQFANRCRNVRNNPRVNYVDEAEDKDRRIRRLTDEIAQLRNRLSQGGSFRDNGDLLKGAGLDKMSPGKLVSLLQKLGINAVLTPDGCIMVDGKKYSFDELGLGEASVSESSAIDGNKSTTGKDSGGGSQQMEKMNKMMKELKESNASYSSKAKERKSQMEEQGKELQRLSSELNKLQTVVAHKEFEIASLIEEKDRSLQEQRALIEAQHAKELENVVNNCNGILQNQQDVVDSVPKALKEYTTLVRKTDLAKTKFEVPLRNEFEEHLKKINKSRLEELDHVKKQFLFYLNEKDTALSEFVDRFNQYRAKKAEQLRMAEREIVKLHDYTEQIEEILNDVEKGKYQVHQKQGAKGGKSTTGMMVQMGIHPATQGGTRPGTATTDVSLYEMDEDDATHATGQYGGIVLPPGVRPRNPLKVNDAAADLALTKRIVTKHKVRVARLEKLKAEAFQKTLFYAGQTGATATANIDGNLQNQIKALLVTKPGGREPTKPQIVGNTVRGNLSGRQVVTAPTNGSRPKETNSSRPVSSGDHSKTLGSKPSSRPSTGARSDGAFDSRPRSPENDNFFQDQSSSKNVGLNQAMMRELEELRERVKEEQVILKRHSLFSFVAND